MEGLPRNYEGKKKEKVGRGANYQSVPPFWTGAKKRNSGGLGDCSKDPQSEKKKRESLRAVAKRDALFSVVALRGGNGRKKEKGRALPINSRKRDPPGPHLYSPLNEKKKKGEGER